MSTTQEQIQPTKLDRAIAWLFPRWGLNRYLARFATWRAADMSRIRGKWMGSDGSADQDNVGDLQAMRKRGRSLSRDNPFAAGILRTLTDNIVGAGFRPQSRPRSELVPGVTEARLEEWSKAATVAWERFNATADVAGRLTFDQQVALACRSGLESGDSFVHGVHVERPDAPYPLGFEVLEADMVDTPLRLADDQSVRGGIKIGRRGQPIIYWTHRRHPGDSRIFANDDMRPIRRRDEAGRPVMIHLMFQERPGQNRGTPRLAPAFSYLDHLDNVVEAESVAVRVAACISGVIKRKNPLEAALRSARTTVGQGGRAERWERMSPGSIKYLNTDEDFDLVNPQRPGATLDLFILRLMRMISRAAHVGYEQASLDFERTTFTSSRAAAQEVRRMFRCDQRVIMRIYNEVWAAVIEQAWLAGDMPDLDFEAFREELLRVTWILPGWGWVDPVKEIKASSDAIAGGLSTRAIEVANNTGHDWLEVQEQLAFEERKIRELRAAQQEEEENGDADDGNDDDEPEEEPEDEDDESEAERRELATAGRT